MAASTPANSRARVARSSHCIETHQADAESYVHFDLKKLMLSLRMRPDPTTALQFRCLAASTTCRTEACLGRRNGTTENRIHRIQWESSWLLDRRGTLGR